MTSWDYKFKLFEYIDIKVPKYDTYRHNEPSCVDFVGNVILPLGII